MPVDASTAHTVNRLVVDTDTAFDDLRHSYESLVPTIDFAEHTALVKAGALSEVKQYTAEHAPHTFVNFWTFDPTPQMQLFGHRTRVVTYMMGNNIIVERMFRHDPGVMRCVCLADLRVGDRARRARGDPPSGQLHMQVNRGGVVRVEFRLTRFRLRHEASCD